MKAALFSLLLLTGSAVAADATLETARRCVQVRDSLERLVCFDRAFANTPAAATAPVTAPVPSATALPKPSSPVVAPAPPAALGDESVKRQERSSPEAPATLIATVAALKETRQGIFRVTLDNGQIWQQMEMESLFAVAVGDTVQVSKGRMGGYQMARVSNGRAGGWARVTRTK